MMSVNSRHGTITSPNSSEELESNLATPATKVSNLSPNDVREAFKAGTTGIIRSKVPPAFVLTQSPQNYAQSNESHRSSGFTSQDPFVSGPTLSATTQSSTDTSKLSPIASSFTPQSLLTSNSASSLALSSQLSESLSKLAGFSASTGLSLPGGSLNSGEHRFGGQLGLSPTNSNERIDSRTGPATDNFPQETSFSTDDGTSRCLMVGQVATDCPAAAIEGFFSPGSFASIKKVIFSDLVMASTVYVHFGDMRDVVKAVDSIECSPWGWSVQFIDPGIVAAKGQSRVSIPFPVSNYEAQVIVTVRSFAVRTHPEDEQDLSMLVFEALCRSGDIMALKQIQSLDPNQNIFRVEFYSSDAVDRLLNNSTWLEVDHFLLNIHRYEPDLHSIRRRSTNRTGPSIIGEEDSGIENALQMMTVSGRRTATRQETLGSPSLPFSLDSTPVGRSLTMRKDLGGHHTPSPLTHNLSGCDPSDSQTSPFWSPAYSNSSGYRIPSSIWSSGSPGAIGQERGAVHSPSSNDFYQKPLGNGAFDMQQHQRSLYKGGRRHNEHNIGTHNVVDIHRIRIGLDVRTTIMLRNIPNKMTSAVLKGILDETSFGKYDFTYLRIDFANNCNVGYAFINFEDPIHIVNFVNARAGRRWNCYNSDKVAEISYATIQGRDCLIQKFRNSSVMLEQPSSRPKIWSTSGPSMGQEEPFPGPDNPSKMRRSVENAEHVGLFAPRAGQNFRDEQRRRRSQYDRGTRLAEIEESYETANYQYRGNLSPVTAQFPSKDRRSEELGQIYYARRAGSF